MNRELLNELEAALRTTLEDDENNGRLERGTVGRVKRALEKVNALLEQQGE